MHSHSSSEQTRATPPDLPAYAFQKTPPPVPKKRFMPGRINKSSTGVISVLVVVGILLLLSIYRYGEHQQKESVAKAKAEHDASIVGMAEAIDGLKKRKLNARYSVRRIYPQSMTELRFQLIDHNSTKPNTDVRKHYNAHKAEYVAAMSSDTISAALLRAAPSIYLDLYDKNDEWMYSYDLSKKDIEGTQVK